MPDEFIKYGKKLIKDFKKEFMMKFDKEYAPYYFTPKAYNWMIDNGLNAKGFGICF
jgi:hypothetical protein